MIPLFLTRDDAEMLVDLLEKGTTLWDQQRRQDVADEIRSLFAMSTKEQSDEHEQIE